MNCRHSFYPADDVIYEKYASLTVDGEKKRSMVHRVFNRCSCNEAKLNNKVSAGDKKSSFFFFHMKQMTLQHIVYILGWKIAASAVFTLTLNALTLIMQFDEGKKSIYKI